VDRWSRVVLTEKFMAAHDLQNSRGDAGITAAAHQMCDGTKVCVDVETCRNLLCG
jgi:hypothetical protein